MNETEPDSPSTASPSSAPRLLALLTQWGSLAALMVATLCTLGAQRWWGFELSTHFEVQYLIGSAVALLVAGLRRSVLGLLVAGALCGWHGTRVLALHQGADAPSTEVARSPVLRLLLANVLTRNQDAQSLLDLIQDEDPDVVCLLEVDRRWLDDLRPLERSHPHFDRHPRDDNFGIAVYSKHPFQRVERVDLGTGAKPSIRADLEHGGRAIHLLVTHPVPPVGRLHGRSRDAQIHDLADLARQLGPRTVIAGDLNATPWTPVFEHLLESARMRDSMQGYGVHATWPARWPSWLRIPIDHVLIGSEVEVLDRRVGPFIGSDHRPVIVDLR